MCCTVRIVSDTVWICLAVNVYKNKNKNVKRKKNTQFITTICFPVKYTNVNKRTQDYLTLRSDTYARQLKVS